MEEVRKEKPFVDWLLGKDCSSWFFCQAWQSSGFTHVAGFTLEVVAKLCVEYLGLLI